MKLAGRQLPTREYNRRVPCYFSPVPKDQNKAQDTDREAMHLAEVTDVSQKQAKSLFREHGGDKKKAAEKARNFKAEG